MADELAVRAEKLAQSLGIPVGLIGDADPEETMQRIMEEIASETTAEAVLKSGVSEKASDNLGVPLGLRGFRWQASDYGAVPFAVVDAVTQDGERKTIVCGGRKVIVKLATIAKLGGFPVAAQFTAKDIDLDGGGKGIVYDLIPADAFVAATK